MYHHNSRVRVIHNVAKGPKVEVILDNKIVLSGVAYKTISNYLQIPSGQHTVSISSNGTILSELSVHLRCDNDYTIIAHGDIENLKSISLLALQDDNRCPKSGKAHVRFIHAAAKVPAVDIWANNTSKVFKNVAYGSTGMPVYLPVNAGEISLSVTPTGTNTVVLGPIDLTLASGNIYTIIATGLLKDKSAPLDVLLVSDAHCSTIHTGLWY